MRALFSEAIWLLPKLRPCQDMFLSPRGPNCTGEAQRTPKLVLIIFCAKGQKRYTFIKTIISFWNKRNKMVFVLRQHYSSAFQNLKKDLKWQLNLHQLAHDLSTLMYLMLTMRFWLFGRCKGDRLDLTFFFVLNQHHVKVWWLKSLLIGSQKSNLWLWNITCKTE